MLLSNTDCLRYDLVKSVLKAYELVPEAYCWRFRRVKRGDKSYLVFARDPLILIVSVLQLRLTYINECSVKTAAKAAALADDYVLT